MPRKPFDPRILLLATQADIKIAAYVSIDPTPPGVTPVAADSPAYPWGWTDVTISADFAGQTREVTLRGVTAASERAFRMSAEYQEALLSVLSSLLTHLDRAVSAVAKLGPRAVAE